MKTEPSFRQTNMRVEDEIGGNVDESDLKSWKSRWDLAGQCEHAKLPAFLRKFGGWASIGFGLI